jgi:uncharacterized protein related to proFAR isomerase
MEIIPLIKLKKRKILGHFNSSPKEILKEIDENEKIYILDLDGIEKDKPNLCTFQKLSDSYDLWVDFGPRNIGDIVDAVMTGTTAMTLRMPLWSKIEISEIRNITENKIFTGIDFESQDKYDFGDLYIQLSDGLVTFNSRELIESSFKNSDFLKTIGMKQKIYTYESDFKNSYYWKRFGVNGLLVDLDKIKEFKNGF